MWALSFFVAEKPEPRWLNAAGLKDGSYSIAFNTLENSPATYLEYAVVIDAPATPAKAFSIVNRSEKLLVPLYYPCKAGEVSQWVCQADPLQM
jgi:hypothetical protein